MADSNDVLNSWLQIVVQTSGVLVTLVFAILAVLWGSTVIPLTSQVRIYASIPLIVASFGFMLAIWLGLDGLGTLTLALTNPYATPSGILTKVQPRAYAADWAFKIGVALIVAASFSVTILSIIGT